MEDSNVHIFSFEKLDVYHLSLDLIKEVYRLANSIPNLEKYGLISQIQRSIVSVASNISEGSGRRGLKDKQHFISIAIGSLMECFCQLQIAVKLEYIDIEELEHIRPKFVSINKMLSRVSRSLETSINP